MSTPLRVVDRVDDQSGYDYEAGDVFACRNYNGSHDVVGRGPCWVVRLPGGGYLWHTNMASVDGGYWDVTGDVPNISVTPSINVGPEIWHGWITAGSLSPDFDSKGRR